MSKKPGIPSSYEEIEEIILKEGSIYIKIYTEVAKFKKLVTILEGIPKKDLENVAKYLKKKLACGGTSKDGLIILQGDHKKKVPELLLEIGYKKDQIQVQ